MAITIRGTAGAWVAANATTQTVTLPTHQTGDMLLVRVGMKHATLPGDITCNTSGWARIGQFNNGNTASGNGLGDVQVAAFWKIATSGAETNPVITYHASVAATPSCASPVVFQKGAAEGWLTPVGDGGAIAAATNISATIQSHVTATTGDVIVAHLVTNDNTTLTVPTFTQTGLTLSAVTEAPATALSDATSNDISADACFRTVTAGTSSAAAVVTGTNSVADVGAAWTTRLRVVPADEGPAEVATGAGAAGDSDVSIASNTEIATGTGSAGDSTLNVAPNAGVAVGTGAALDATVDTVAGAAAKLRVYDIEFLIPAAGAATYANAEAAAGTGTASGPSARVAPSVGAIGGNGAASSATTAVLVSAQVAAGTGAALAARSSVKPNAGLAAGTGAASNAAVSTAVRPTAATGTGAASGASARVAVNALAAGGTGTAHNATVSTLVVTHAQAQAASGAGAASGASVHVRPRPTTAAGSGQALDATGRSGIEAAAEVAAGAGQAYNATVAAGQYAQAETAAGAGQGVGPSAAVAVNAGVATGSGAAYDAYPATIVAAFAFAQTATGTGSALGVSAHVQPHGGLASGSSHPGSEQGLATSTISVESVSSSISVETVSATIEVDHPPIFATISVDDQVSATVSVESALASVA